MKGYCQHSSEACRFSHDAATPAQLQELQEEWNQKKLLNAPQFQQHNQQQQHQHQQPSTELDTVLSSVPPGSFGTGSTDTILSYGTAVAASPTVGPSTAVPPTMPHQDTPPQLPQLNYSGAMAVQPTPSPQALHPLHPTEDSEPPHM